MLAWLFTTLLFLAAFYALFSATKQKDWVAFLISSGFIVSLVFLRLSPSGLFYHSVALAVISSFALLLSTLFTREGMSTLHRVLILVISLPYITVCSFKVLQFQGIDLLSYSLYLSVLAFIYFSIDRRVWDHYWAQGLFITLSSVLLLLQ